MLVVQAIIDGVLSGGVYALMAAGLTLVFGVMNVINVAQGVLVCVGAYLSYTVVTRLGLDPFVSLLITIPAMFVFGALTYRVIVARLGSKMQANGLLSYIVMALLTMFAIGTIVEGALDMIYGPGYVQITRGYVNKAFHFSRIYVPEMYLYGFLLAVVLLGVLYLLLYKTRLGRAVRACAQNQMAARLVGINVRTISTIVFGVGIAVTAAGGMVFGATNAFNANSGADLISRLLTIVVLGGMTSMGGTLVAAVIMMVVESLAGLWSPIWAPVVFDLVLVLVLVTRPSGLFPGTAGRQQ